MVTAMNDLPFEILVYILSFLPGKSLPTVARISKRFYEVVHVESVWQRRCEEEYGIFNTDCKGLSFKDLYCKLLSPYGWTLGLWQKCQNDDEHYGAVVYVEYSKGSIVGHQLLPPVMNQIDKPLQPRKLFSIHFVKQGDNEMPYSQIEQLCCLNNAKDEHDCILEQIENEFSWQCVKPESHDESRDDVLLQQFLEWVLLETNGRPAEYFHHLMMSRFSATVWPQYNTKFQLTRLVVPPHQAGRLIQPGLFLGNYGPHGMEIMMLQYNDENNTVEVNKITGDPNVPCWKTSIIAELSRPMILIPEQQVSVALLQEIDTPDLPPDQDLDHLPRQQFIVPRDCNDRDGDPPDTCIARFHSKGHIAGHNYRDPSYIPGHWIIFDEDTFAHIWLNLGSLGMFRRIKQPLCPL